jgi:hypothetical protein
MTREIIEAGGIAVGNLGGSGVDTITAREYRHPALDGDRLVVRLVPAGLGEAEDLAMEFLGFAAAGEPRPVGTGARQALGFPAWALVHDPANGRHALAMVKEMERLARLAKTKPGNAKLGYDQLAARLGNAAPHFLPTFWEQAGRAFIAADNAKTAGTCFGEARQAELVHALAIDEARLGDVYLEFALAGALPVKALAQYARDLTGRLSPERAYRQLRAVAVHRVAGGLAPHTGMAEDLARLAKAALLRPDDEAEGVLEELLALPAVAKAPFGFWKSYRRPLVRLARRSAAVRGRLLALRPDPPGTDVDLGEFWIGLLDEGGATAGLTGDVEPAAGPVGGAGAWLERFLTHGSPYYGRARSAPLLNLVERMLPKLRAEGRELRPFGEYPHGADLDVLDLLIAGGIPVVECRVGYFSVGKWLQDDGPGRRDLAALAGYRLLAEPWRAGVRQAITPDRHRRGGDRELPVLDPDYVARLRASPGLRTTLAAWLADVADARRDRPLAALGDLIDQVASLHSPAGAAIAPDVVRRIAATDVAPALARALRVGLVAELRWAAYEEARGGLSDRDPVSEDPNWPHLIVHDYQRAVVLGPDGVVLDHLLRLPPDVSRYGWSRPQCVYADGQLRVQWSSRDGRRAYWSGQPDEVFEVTGPTHWNTSHLAMPVELADGAVTTGERPWHAGDRADPERLLVAGDGVNFWRLEHLDGYGIHARWAWREYDPASGAVGRQSRPRFFEEGGEGLTDTECVLLPAPGAEGSPLGWADGLVGWRVRRDPDGSTVGAAVDGRRVALPVPSGERLVAAVALPGAAEPRPVLIAGDGRLTLCEPGSGLAASRIDAGTPVPPVLWWHWMVPRDEAGSQALRSVSTETAASLLKPCLDAAGPDRPAAADEAVRGGLPAVTDPGLRAAVVAQVLRAAEYVRWLTRFGEYTDTPAAKPRTAVVDNRDLAEATRGLDERRESYYYGPSIPAGSQLLPAIAATGDALHGRADAIGVRLPEIDWPTMLGAEWALAIRAVSPVLPEAHRSALGHLLDTVARAGLVAHGGRLRVLALASTATGEVDLGTVISTGDSRLVIVHSEDVWDGGARTKRFRALQYAPGGQFGPVEGFTIIDDRRPGSRADPGRIATLLNLAARHGPVPWRPERVDRLVALTGMSRGEAAMLLAGLPQIMSWLANFLPAATRQVLGLSAAEARAARDALRDLPTERRVALLDALMPDDPALLWTAGPDLDRLAAAWAGFFGRRRAVAEEVLLEVSRLSPRGDGVEVVRAVTNPDTSGWLAPGSLPPDNVRSVAVVLRWLVYRLPIGDPARAALPEAYERVRAALRHPEMFIGAGYLRSDRPVPPALVGSEPRGDVTYYWFAPARLTGPDDPALAMFPLDPGAAALRTLLSPELAALMAAVRAESGPPGTYPQDARASAPDLVEEVRARYRIGADAAAYYLQLLALPDPTDRTVERWTGWSAATRKKVQAELVAAGLVVEAKRARAGRTAFLPGGWLPLKAPNLPVEQWKAALYGLPDETLTLPLILPPGTVPDLFRAAWQRVAGGDEPRFHALRETR